MIAQVTGLEAGDINYYIKDAHIYKNQVSGIQEQINRWDKFKNLKKLNISKLNLLYVKIANLLHELQIYPDKYKTDILELEQEKNMIEFILREEKPELWLNPEVSNFFQFDNSKELVDVKIKKYRHLGKISFPIAQ